MEKQELMKQLGERLKKERLSLGLTQKQFGDIIGVSQKYLSEIERGKKTTTLANIIYICNIFNLNIDYLIYGIVPPHQNLTKDKKQYKELKHLLSQCTDEQYDLCIRIIRSITCNYLFSQKIPKNSNALEEPEKYN